MYASRRGGLPPSRLAVLPGTAELRRFWVWEGWGEFHQLEGEMSRGEILGLGVEGGNGTRGRGSKTPGVVHAHGPFWVGERGSH